MNQPLRLNKFITIYRGFTIAKSPRTPTRPSNVYGISRDGHYFGCELAEADAFRFVDKLHSELEERESKIPAFWLTLARAGETTDGRYIASELLENIAASYSPDDYGARIYREHDHINQALLGCVLKTKTEAKNGSIALQALVEPTVSWFTAFSAEEINTRKIYPAPEVALDWTEISRPYLIGVSLGFSTTINNVEPINHYMIIKEISK